MDTSPTREPAGEPAGDPGPLFEDRREAGRALGELLTAYRDSDDVVVFGLARGSVPVAFAARRVSP